MDLMKNGPIPCDNHTIEYYDINDPTVGVEAKRFFVVQHLMFYDSAGIAKTLKEVDGVPDSKYLITFWSPRFETVCKMTIEGLLFPEYPLPCESRFGPFDSAKEAVDYWNAAIDFCRTEHKDLIDAINNVGRIVGSGKATNRKDLH